MPVRKIFNISTGEETEIELTPEEIAEIAAAQPTLAEAATAKLAMIQAEKVRARDAGFLVDGVLFDSDAEARVAYLELAAKLAADSGYTTSWKASAGQWVTMDATLYAAVYAAGEIHIAAVFAWQAAREAEVAAALAAEDAEALAAVSAVYGA